MLCESVYFPINLVYIQIRQGYIIIYIFWILQCNNKWQYIFISLRWLIWHLTRLWLASERIIASIKQKEEKNAIVVITGAKDRAEIDYTRHAHVARNRSFLVLHLAIPVHLRPPVEQIVIYASNVCDRLTKENCERNELWRLAPNSDIWSCNQPFAWHPRHHVFVSHRDNIFFIIQNYPLSCTTAF